MGAELILAVCPAFDQSADRRKELEKALSQLTPKETAYLLEEMLYTVDDANENGEDPLVRVKAEILEAFDEVSEQRDVVVHTFPECDYEVFISGGMSWGDDPCDTHVSRLSGLPLRLYNLLEEWAKEDMTVLGPAARMTRYGRDLLSAAEVVLEQLKSPHMPGIVASGNIDALADAIDKVKGPQADV